MAPPGSTVVMRTIVKLDNPVQHYAWGSRNTIADFQRRLRSDDSPEAELWIGAHALAPSAVVSDGSRSPLDRWIAEDPEAVLGRACIQRFGSELPYLVKLLAAAQPLSLQVHPSAQQAASGFARENADHVPRDAPERSYRDPHPKQEMLVALEPFHALCGFRGAEEVARLVTTCGSPRLARLHADLSSERSPAAALFLALLELEGDERRETAREIARGGDVRAPASDPLHWIPEIVAHHPDDPLAAAPLLLHLVELAPLEAIAIAPGQVHSYLRGFGVEIMTPSDNTIRGGLTPKHTDAAELAAVWRPEPQNPTLLRAELKGAGWRRYPSPAPEFAVSLQEVAGRAAGLRAAAPRIALCLDGAVALNCCGAAAVELQRGASALIPACIDDYHCDGQGRILWVHPPPGNDSDLRRRRRAS